MANPIRVTIRGSDALGTDAPKVEDLLGQMRDFVDLLKGVERALDDGGAKIVWRVTDVTKNSPIAFEISPFPDDPAAYVDDRAFRVERAASDGLRLLQDGVERPPYFTDEVMPKALQIHKRITNGLAETTIKFPVFEMPLVITKSDAATVTRAAEARQAEAPVAYRELGSIEGFFAKAELDGMGRPVLWFRRRIDNQLVKAVAAGDAFRQFEGLRLGDVWGGARIRVYGTIHYKNLGVIDHIKASALEALDASPLPGLADIIDPDFTGSLTTEQFLSEVRNG